MRFLLGFGSCAIGVGAEEVAESLEILLQNTDYVLEKVGCNGLCFAEPVLQIINDDGEDAFYGYLNPDSACQVVKEALLGQKYSQNLLCDELRFLEPQKRLVLRNMGLIDPEKIADYIQRDGYQALEQALSMPREDIIKIIDDAQLRSRVGDGVCVGQKWHSVNESPLQEKYIICNIDPGDSGAFVDRSLLEGDPHGILEGIIIAGYAIQAKMAFIYINDEYDLPILRLEKALQQARQLGYLGNNILAEGWDFNIEIVYKKRESFFRDLARDYINTARFMDDGETFANIPWIISHGSQAFASIGTENSKGTKVFSLAGQVERGGLIEIPMGFTLRDVIYQIGNGLQTNKPFKAVQLGGPWGIFFPENLLDTPIDYRNILAMGGAIGSGVLMVIDSTDCIIDIVNYF
ncbi:MAG: NADH-quinone oxidoreductase subunit F, partial [Clostridiales bacterium]